jgi:hypothetical protein
MTDTLTCVRVITYVGERTWMEHTIAQSLHGLKVFPGKGMIHASTVLVPKTEKERISQMEHYFAGEREAQKDG